MSQGGRQEPLPRGPLPAKLESHCAVFFDNADRLLLLKKTYGSNPWGFPGGVAEPDEPPRTTVRREVEEEIGLVKEPGALLVSMLDGRSPRLEPAKQGPSSTSRTAIRRAEPEP